MVILLLQLPWYHLPVTVTSHSHHLPVTSYHDSLVLSVATFLLHKPRQVRACTLAN